ncbi:N-acetylmuramoyl-L-alanine amidase, partial [Brevibacterium paucivorans]
KTPSIFSPVGRELANLVSREIASRTPLLDCRSHAKSWESLRVLNTPKIYVLAGYASNKHD